jgi:hypothetical protein
MQTAIRSLVERFPNLRLVTSEPRWEEHMLVRALKELPVRF